MRSQRRSKTRRSSCATLHPLQFRENPQDSAHRPGDGRWHLGSCVELRGNRVAGGLTMAPIISGSKSWTESWMEGLFAVAIIFVFFVLMSPDLTSIVLRQMPWLAPVIHLLHRILDRN